jgi:hypothetical protein
MVRSAYRLLIEQEAQERDHGERRASHLASKDDPHWEKNFGDAKSYQKSGCSGGGSLMILSRAMRTSIDDILNKQGPAFLWSRDETTFHVSHPKIYYFGLCTENTK